MSTVRKLAVLAVVAALVAVWLLVRQATSPPGAPAAATDGSAPPTDASTPPTDDGHGDGRTGDTSAEHALLACLDVAPASDDEIPDEIRAVVDLLTEKVTAERELAFEAPVETELLPVDEFTARDLERKAGYTPAVADLETRMLTALGAAAPGTDLREVMLADLSDRSTGYYEPATGKVVARSDAGADPAAVLTLAHELDHALTDQALGLPDLAGMRSLDAAMAANAVTEGDAMLLTYRWGLRHPALAEELRSADWGMSEGSGLPNFVHRQLAFPYLAGADFVCEQFRAGGWDAVDQLYSALPSTTAQILWPERYHAGEEAVDVSAPTPPPGRGWRTRRMSTLGAAELLWLFEAPGDDPAAAVSDPRERAAAWAGGELTLWTRDDETAVGLVLADRGEAPPLCDSVNRWYGAAFPTSTVAGDEGTTTFEGSTQAAAVRCRGTEVRVGIAPDLEAALAVAGS